MMLPHSQLLCQSSSSNRHVRLRILHRFLPWPLPISFACFETPICWLTGIILDGRSLPSSWATLIHSSRLQNGTYIVHSPSLLTS